VLVINKGKLVADGNFEDLRKQLTTRASLSLAVKAPRKEVEQRLKALDNLSEVTFHDSGERGVTRCVLSYELGKDLLSDLNQIIRDAKWDIVEFHEEKLSLEDSFILLTQGGESEEGAAQQGSAAQA